MPYPMAEPTIDAMLVNIRTAINDALISGGEVEIELAGRRIRRDFDQLLAIESRLMQRQGSAQSLRTFAEFRGRPL